VAAPGEARWGSRNWGGASRKAIWWDLCLASLLTHLLLFWIIVVQTVQVTPLRDYFTDFSLIKMHKLLSAVAFKQ